MKPIITSLTLVSTVLLFTSCKSNPAGPSNDQYIWPLHKGNLWTYHIVSYDSAGQVIGDGDFTFSIASDTVVAGETWHNLSNFAGGMFCRNRSDGFWIMENGVQFLFFKFPGSVGDTWGAGGQSIEIHSTDSSITTESGTFTCYEYQVSYDFQPGECLHVYLFPGVGMVAEEYYMTTSLGVSYRAQTVSLTSYAVN